MEGGGGKSAGARVSSPTAASSASTEGERVGAMCPICFEPLSCNGMHRICCLPCGHVYGRSCLERSYDASGDKSDKCPQCGRIFAIENIINLYTPVNLWDNCCHSEEEKLKLKKQLDDILEDHEAATSRDEASLRELRSQFSEEKEKVLAEMRLEFSEMLNKQIAELSQSQAQV